MSPIEGEEGGAAGGYGICLYTRRPAVKPPSSFICGSDGAAQAVTATRAAPTSASPVQANSTSKPLYTKKGTRWRRRKSRTCLKGSWKMLPQPTLRRSISSVGR